MGTWGVGWASDWVLSSRAPSSRAPLGDAKTTPGPWWRAPAIGSDADPIHLRKRPRRASAGGRQASSGRLPVALLGRASALRAALLQGLVEGRPVGLGEEAHRPTALHAVGVLGRLQVGDVGLAGRAELAVVVEVARIHARGGS